jgi:predicted membrane protein
MEQPNPGLQWLIEHPGVPIIITVLWHLWIAIALGYICIQLYKHNEREEQEKIKRQYNEEKREREIKANSFKSETTQIPDSRFPQKS